MLQSEVELVGHNIRRPSLCCGRHGGLPHSKLTLLRSLECLFLSQAMQTLDNLVSAQAEYAFIANERGVDGTLTEIMNHFKDNPEVLQVAEAAKLSLQVFSASTCLALALAWTGRGVDEAAHGSKERQERKE